MVNQVDHVSLWIRPFVLLWMALYSSILSYRCKIHPKKDTPRIASARIPLGTAAQSGIGRLRIGSKKEASDKRRPHHVSHGP